MFYSCFLSNISFMIRSSPSCQLLFFICLDFISSKAGICSDCEISWKQWLVEVWHLLSLLMPGLHRFLGCLDLLTHIFVQLTESSYLQLICGGKDYGAIISKSWLSFDILWLFEKCVWALRNRGCDRSLSCFLVASDH